MAGSYEAPGLDCVSREMWHIAVRRQQLLNRRAILVKMQEFRQRNVDQTRPDQTGSDQRAERVVGTQANSGFTYPASEQPFVDITVPEPDYDEHDATLTERERELAPRAASQERPNIAEQPYTDITLPEPDYDERDATLTERERELAPRAASQERPNIAEQPYAGITLPDPDYDESEKTDDSLLTSREDGPSAQPLPSRENGPLAQPLPEEELNFPPPSPRPDDEPSELEMIDEELRVLEERKEELAQRMTTQEKPNIAEQTFMDITVPEPDYDGADKPMDSPLRGVYILPFITPERMHYEPPVTSEPHCASVDESNIPPPSSIPDTAPRELVPLEKLSRCAAMTRCPACEQDVTTEIQLKAGGTVWLLCCMSIMLGGVAGCCLIPFCVDSLKDVSHRCPRCEASIAKAVRL